MQGRTRGWLRRRRLVAVGLFALGVAMLLPASAGAVAGAAFTTDNPNAEHVCLHGPSGDALAVNCNIFESKEHVWINGGPSLGQNHLSNGEYFFAVLVPGGQPDPNDDGAKNLSDESSVGGIDDECGSPYTDRTFTVTDGKISAFTGAGASCTYATDSNYDPPMGLLVNLFPYDTTSNPGGVYILAICSLEDGYPASPRDCKYDAFKVREGETPPVADLTILKNATESFDRTYAWDIDKSADTTFLQTTATSVTVNYTVLVSHDGGTDSGWAVGGTISVFNPNMFPVEVDVTDAIDDPNATCSVTDGEDATIAAESSEDFDYSCTYSDEPATGTSNTATVEWDETGDLAAGSADWTVPIDFSGVTPDEIDECIDVTDDFDGGGPVALGSVCVGDPGHVLGDETAWGLTYSRVIAVPRNDCVTKNNTAAFVTNNSGATGSDNWSVTLCGPITNGFTIGFWTNKNGADALNACAGGGWSAAATYLSSTLYLVNAAGTRQTFGTNGNGLKAFQTWLKNAEATNMSHMLSAQLAATALDVRCKGMDGDAYVAHPVSGVPITISALITEASAFVSTHTVTLSGADRNAAEAYKNVFDALNNNKAFAVPAP